MYKSNTIHANYTHITNVCILNIKTKLAKLFVIKLTMKTNKRKFQFEIITKIQTF